MGKVIRAAFSGKSQQPAPGFGADRPRNADVRPREYLTPDEVRLVADAAKTGRNPLRDELLILALFRHALRASEAANLQWPHVHFGRMNQIDIRRAKGGIDSTHPMERDEVRQLRQLQRTYPNSRWVFVSERGSPLSEDTIHGIVRRAGVAAGIPFPIHPHMFRHSRGYKLAREGRSLRDIQLFMGHKRIENTVRYMSADASRFDGFTTD